MEKKACIAIEGGSALIDGILPAAGLATRMRGLPKFLLPCDDEYTTLIEKHVSSLLETCDTVWIPTRPEQTILLETLGISSDRVVVVPMTTATMTQTVLRLANISGASRFVMVMPDTHFVGEQPYQYLSEGKSDLNLACWKIRQEQLGKLGQVLIEGGTHGKVLDSKDKDPNCAFPHSWGAMSFNRSILQLAVAEMPHTGYAINPALMAGKSVEGKVFSGKYFDCGTPREYLELLALST
jgi:choline kinase